MGPHVAVRVSSKRLHRCSSRYSSPLAAYSRIRYTRFCARRRRLAHSSGPTSSRAQIAGKQQVLGGQLFMS